MKSKLLELQLKRTELYAFLLNDKVTSFENEQSLALGVRHRF